MSSRGIPNPERGIAMLGFLAFAWDNENKELQKNKIRDPSELVAPCA